MSASSQNPLFPTYSKPDLLFQYGKGSYLYSDKDEAYLDFTSGIAVNSLGHAHPRLVAALEEQSKKLWHVSNLYRIEPQEKLAEKLVQNSFADHVFFVNSGAEALECAIKTARRYFYSKGDAEKYRFITFEGAFHGRTLATIAAGGKAQYLEGFGPPLEGFDQVPFADLEAVEKMISPKTAAVLVEPVQGEGGVNIFPPEKLVKLRALCDEHNILLVLDEVQTGIGRSGKLFAYQHSGIRPDILASAKGIGGGFPLGACLATHETSSAMVPGTHGSTFGGNPLACAVGLEVLNIILEDGFLEQVNKTSLLFKQKLAALVDGNRDIIDSIKGEGLLLGLSLKVPVQKFGALLMEQKMLAPAAANDVLRLLPPLNTTAEELDEACNKIEQACSTLRQGTQK